MAGQITLLTASSRPSYTQMVNLGLTLHRDRDVAIVRRNTIVYDGWLDSIVSNAGARVATVNPLTNQRDRHVAGYPLPSDDSPRDLEVTDAKLNQIAATVNAGRNVEVHRTEGFCMFIRRASLDEVGLFDSTNFPKRDLAETDFCLRARKLGWHHVVAGDVFVTDKEGLSSSTRVSTELEKLARYHPEYRALEDTICELDPVRTLRRAIDIHRINLLIGGNPTLAMALDGDDVTLPVPPPGFYGMFSTKTLQFRFRTVDADDAFPNVGAFELPRDIVHLNQTMRLLGITSLHCSKEGERLLTETCRGSKEEVPLALTMQPFISAETRNAERFYGTESPYGHVIYPPFDLAALTNSTSDSTSKETKYVVFCSSAVEAGLPSGLHPKVKLIIPTRGCSKWLPYFLDAYQEWGISPTFAVDNGSEPATLDILKKRNIDLIFIDKAPRNGESIMPFISRSVEEDYIFRLDDDEFPTKDMIHWINSIPDSEYRFVHSWWLPRYEVAMIDGRLCSCHPRWLNVKVGATMYQNLHGGRFYRHREVVYDEVGPHHGNFLSDFVSHAPLHARMIHLDYLVRTPEERINKIRNTEKTFKNAGWPFANHMVPEIAPRPLLNLREFDQPELNPLVNRLVRSVYRPSERLSLTVDELQAIQQDRLSLNEIFHHY